jgi:uncharacterized protein YtpQ (UPF0354 family)
MICFKVNYENNQQDALYRFIYYSKSALHVSGNVFTHHQEPSTVFTVSGSVHPSCYRLVSWMGFNSFETPHNYENKQQDALYRLIYYSKSALQVSGNVFSHHQEHSTVFTVSSSVHPSCCRLVSWMGFNSFETPHNYENNQQDALYRLIYYSKSALHVSGFNSFETPAGSNLGEH